MENPHCPSVVAAEVLSVDCFSKRVDMQAEPGQTIQLGRVLAVKENGNFNIGAPYLENAVVKAQIVEDLKGPKLTIFKMRAKKHYRRKTGHRQPLTQFYVTEISI